MSWEIQHGGQRVVDGVGVRDTALEVEGGVLGTTVDCEGDRVKRS